MTVDEALQIAKIVLQFKSTEDLPQAVNVIAEEVLRLMGREKVLERRLDDQRGTILAMGDDRARLRARIAKLESMVQFPITTGDESDSEMIDNMVRRREAQRGERI